MSDTTTYSNALSYGQSTPAFGIVMPADIDNIIVPMLAETQFTIENQTVMSQLVRTVTLARGVGDAYREPKMGTLTAFALSVGVDMQQAQKLSDSIWTVTPAEIGLQVVMPDKVTRTVRDNQPEIAGKLMGNAVMRKIDQDGIATGQAASLGLGSAGTAMTWAYIAAGHSAIEGEEEPAPGPFNLVQHSHAYHPFAKNLAPTGTYPIPNGISQEVIEKGFVAKSVTGTALWKDNNITKDSSDDAVGFVFSREAMLLVKSLAPTMEKQRDASLRAWEMNYVTEYGWGIYQDKWMRKMTFDAVTPTS